MISSSEQDAKKNDAHGVCLEESRPSLIKTYQAWLNRGVWLGLRWRLHKSNRFFFGCICACCFLLTLMAFWPIFRDLFRGYSRLDASAEFGIAKNKPLYVTNYFWLCLAGMLFAAVYYFRCLDMPRLRTMRLFAVIGVCLYLAVLVYVRERVASGQRVLGALSSGELFELQWHNFDHLKITECASAQLNMSEIRADLQHRHLKNFGELHQAVMEQYRKNLPKLEKRWENAGPMDEQKRKALFIMNFVSSLWRFGPPDLNYENVKSSPVDVYLRGEIACCTEQSYLTKSLLDHEGIENRLTTIPGHIFNEVKLACGWCVLDSSANIFMETSWKGLFEKTPSRRSVVVLMFPHVDKSAAKDDLDSSLSTQFRVMTLIRAANHPNSLSHPQPSPLPSYFD
jgi:hypothetical protein